jgi:hypothetical protein
MTGCMTGAPWTLAAKAAKRHEAGSIVAVSLENGYGGRCS